MAHAYDYEKQEAYLSNGEIHKFNCGGDIVPEIGHILFSFKTGNLSLQEAYYILANGDLVDNWY